MSNNPSIRSRSSDASVWTTDGRWNVPKLLELSDLVRSALSKGANLSSQKLEELNFVLDMLLVDKLDEEHKITFSVIQRARLDKLLADMLRAHDKEATAVPLGDNAIETGLRSETETASSLQRCWQSRFESDYLAIDKYRYEDLMSGSLRDMVWSATASDGLGVWIPKEVIEISEVEGNATFFPGQYKIHSWSIKLNMASEVYTLRLTLERLPGQTPMEKITTIPKPSQLDEWLLYEQLERDHIRQTEGQIKLDDWTIARNVERIERDEWRRSREFRITMCEGIKEGSAGAQCPVVYAVGGIGSEWSPSKA
ncbi:hypothetical protein M406DRAFT_245904 [Cryphonectria parasitica EP155]|uniref:Uncharacterized protein n=1 Tax=Cryphonectria parasitica (strain ATCC 38755 / EP155) TaxID=660469 RepID=A0A9P4YCI1_CRYP1|nr:uncharacterized protein M406DRAFT_245904 [Cryphonectria parasitica EP155]KAF3770145.1 hypothetical protein M406DRAFT_245904 [Cryphonectria parasitica EP155]